ncbi:glycosyltransferase family 4 protein [Chromobacterium violaceum]|uniref:glycosyltransferase family 4 protein n=1 Tax=Chromobacterium violaceum TaxID=536 RepID=UPI001B320052|nr:glycosyltransferase family 1 protein [Chromobacterium violaceum]MBP4044685.1 glycosyltransferase family 4 protein [Chromobacterium violaceum]
MDKPIIWMNVTTSANWSRPPVGIVRVEQALCNELETLLGNATFKRCIWIDDNFVEWAPQKKSLSPGHKKILDSVFPQSKSFDLARALLENTLDKLKVKECNNEFSFSISKNNLGDKHPKSGDVIISIGLDWDQPYTSNFYSLEKNKGIKIITCCYDLIPVIFPQYCVGEVAKRFKEYFTQLSWGSSAVLCISEQTRSDYIGLCKQIGIPERLTSVMPLGDNVPSDVGEISVQVEEILNAPFILFVSTIERRKNHEVLYRAFHILARSGYKNILPKLVFVGMQGWGVGDLMKDIELDPETKGLIVQLNHVNDSELNALYKNSKFCLYPSLYEGWGLPVGEALSLGKAVISSAKGSLPEVGGDLVHYVDPWNPQAWADAIIEYVKNPDLVKSIEEKVREKYKKREWSQTALAVKKIVDEVISRPATPIVIYPGYEMSTQAGIHSGSSLISTGEGGFLQFGPHRYLSSGSYKISIWMETLKTTSGEMTIDFVSNLGERIHYAKGFSVTNAIDSTKPFVEFEVKSNHQIEQYEVRCIISSNLHISINKIEIEKTS